MKFSKGEKQDMIDYVKELGFEKTVQHLLIAVMEVKTHE